MFAGIRAQVPMLAAIQNMLPMLALPFSIIILLGVFTTITGCLWAIGRRFAEDRAKKQAISLCPWPCRVCPRPPSSP